MLEKSFTSKGHAIVNAICNAHAHTLYIYIYIYIYIHTCIYMYIYIYICWGVHKLKSCPSVGICRAQYPNMRTTASTLPGENSFKRCAPLLNLCWTMVCSTMDLNSGCCKPSTDVLDTPNQRGAWPANVALHKRRLGPSILAAVESKTWMSHRRGWCSRARLSSAPRRRPTISTPG